MRIHRNPTFWFTARKLRGALKILLGTNKQVGDLQRHSAHLRTLQHQFQQSTHELRIVTRTYVERRGVEVGRRIFGLFPGIRVLVVDPSSAEHGGIGEIAVPLAEDHFSICKPSDRRSQIHSSLVTFLRALNPVPDAHLNAVVAAPDGTGTLEAYARPQQSGGVEVGNAFESLARAPLANHIENWRTNSAAALSKGILREGGTLPPDTLKLRAMFQDAWSSANVAELRSADREGLFDGLKNVVETYRLEEWASDAKPNSFQWCIEGIRFFHNISDPYHEARMLALKAALNHDQAQLHNANSDKFLRFVEEGERSLSDAFVACGDCPAVHKAEILRRWSYAYYDLSRPKGGNLGLDWDGAHLIVAYQRMIQAYDLDSANILNLTQLARVVQKLGENPPNRFRASWTGEMRRVLALLRAAWSKVEGSLCGINGSNSQVEYFGSTDLGHHSAGVRGFKESTRQPTIENRRAWADELENCSTNVQSEVIVALPNSYWRSFRFDVNYDLARMHALAWQLELDGAHGQGGLSQSQEVHWQQVMKVLRIALNSAGAVQRANVLHDLNLTQRSGWRGLPKERLQELKSEV